MAKVESIVVNHEEIYLVGGRDKVGQSSEVHKYNYVHDVFESSFLDIDVKKDFSDKIFIFENMMYVISDESKVYVINLSDNQIDNTRQGYGSSNFYKKTCENLVAFTVE